jgi:hypothetical protein
MRVTTIYIYIYCIYILYIYILNARRPAEQTGHTPGPSRDTHRTHTWASPTQRARANGLHFPLLPRIHRARQLPLRRCSPPFTRCGGFAPPRKPSSTSSHILHTRAPFICRCAPHSPHPFSLRAVARCAAAIPLRRGSAPLAKPHPHRHVFSPSVAVAPLRSPPRRAAAPLRFGAAHSRFSPHLPDPLTLGFERRRVEALSLFHPIRGLNPLLAFY